MENLIKFSTEEEWENSDLEYPDVASIESNNGINYIDPHATVGNLETAGGIVLWDDEKKRKMVVQPDEYSIATYPNETFTPIGVLVCPASHMPDGRARMMALMWMNLSKPERGNLTAENIPFGNFTNLDSLTVFTEVPIISSATNQVVSEVNEGGNFSSDYSGYTGTSNPQDSGTKWNNNMDVNLIASPYTSDGTPNPNYRATSYSGGSINNVLSDFDGRGNTDKILAVRGSKDYSYWKPTYESGTDYPAASCCDMYYTVGTSQGDWYLPSIGELGYVMARLGVIINTTVKLNALRDITSKVVLSSNINGIRCWQVMMMHGNATISEFVSSANSVFAFSML